MNLPIGQLIQGASNARNAFVGGQQERQKDDLATALMARKLEREAQEQSLRDALTRAQTGKLLQPPPPARDYVKEHEETRKFDIAHPMPTTPARDPVKDHEAIRKIDIANPLPQVGGPRRDPVADHIAMRNYDNTHQAPKNLQTRALPSSAIDKLSGLDAMQIMAENVKKGLEAAIKNKTDATGRVGGVIKEPNWVMNMRGKGGDAGRDVRTDIGNLYGTVAKERGGTALSAAELSLLESYVPNKDEDEAIALSKAAKFIETLEKIKAAKVGAYQKYGYGQDDQAPLGDHLEGSAPPGSGRGSGDPEFDALMAKAKKRKTP